MESTLECRVAFAQVVMRLELLADSFGMNVAAGEQEEDRSYYMFRTTDRNPEGGRSALATLSDPFHEPAVEDATDQLVAETPTQKMETMRNEKLSEMIRAAVREEVQSLLAVASVESTARASGGGGAKQSAPNPPPNVCHSPRLPRTSRLTPQPSPATAKADALSAPAAACSGAGAPSVAAPEPHIQEASHFKAPSPPRKRKSVAFGRAPGAKPASHLDGFKAGGDNPA